MISSQYLPQTANCQHRIQKVMSCCLRSFVVTKTLFNKDNFTLSPKSVLSSLGRNWTGRITEESSYYSQTYFICAAARNCVLSGLSTWHIFEAPLTDSKLTTALNSLLLKRADQKLCSSLEIYWHDLTHVKKESKVLFHSPLKGGAAYTRLAKGHRP